MRHPPAAFPSGAAPRAAHSTTTPGAPAASASVTDRDTSRTLEDDDRRAGRLCLGGADRALYAGDRPGGCFGTRGALGVVVDRCSLVA